MTTTTSTLFLSLTLALLAGAPARAQEETKPGGKPAPARLSAPARAALSAAAKTLEKAKGTKGEARKTILREAAQAYEKVAADLASEPAGAARAAFEAGETWRRLGELDKAGACFDKALAADAARFGGPASLELAHIARRRKSLDRAVELYGKVAGLEPRSARGHEARLWTARCLEAMGKKDEALQALRGAADKAATPRQQIDACDRLANLLVKRGDLDGAAAAITRAEQAAASVPSGKRDSKTLAKASASMSARRALQRARDKKNGAHKDAQQVDKGAGKDR